MKKNKFALVQESLPVSTQWTVDAVNEVGRATIPNVFKICTLTGSKGSGFLLINGYIITNRHVVENARSDQIFAYSSSGQEISFSYYYDDNRRNLDLVLLKPSSDLEGGLNLDLNCNIKIGESVHTWGYLLAHHGPAPLLSVGYLAGFNESKYNGQTFKHLVVNGAFNNGNSGGALFKHDNDKVIGIVVSKRLPVLSPYTRQAIQILAGNQCGGGFSMEDNQGNKKLVFESQIVVDILSEYRSLAQVMIGEAISASELVKLIQDVAERLYQEAIKNKKLTDQNPLSLFQEAKKLIEKVIPINDLHKKIDREISLL